MTPSLKYMTPFLVAAAAIACSASENNPSGGGKGGSSQTGKGGNAGASSTSGGTGTATGGNNGNPQGGASGFGNSTGGTATGGSLNGGSLNGGSAGASGNATAGRSTTTGGAAGGSATGGISNGGAATGGISNGGAAIGGAGGGSATGGSGGSVDGCSNTDTSKINLDASGFVCNNTLGIKGAWYCYSDGSDSGTSCKGSDGKGTGAIPWNATSSAMCMSGTMGTGDGKYAGIGFKLNSGPPGDMAAAGSWDGSKLVGFAVTLTSGASGKGSGGMVLNLEYPTSNNLDPQTKDAPGITLPGVAGTEITYNVLFADSVLANNANNRTSVDPTKLTDIKLAFFPDSVQHAYDFCIKSIVPLTTAPNPVVATGNYGPTWNNQLSQAVNGVNGYAVQSAPFPTNGNAMTMQVKATAGGVGFSYMTGSGYQAPNNGPGSFPAVISGWGPGHDGIQFYGPYKGGKKISQLTSVKSNWSFTMGSTGDAVYDLWFSNAGTQPPPVPGIELMIWIGNTGKNPLGSAAGGTFMGKTVYVGTNGTGEQVVSYWVAAPGTSSVTNFDLLPYLQDAASHGYAGLSNNSVLLGVQTGFEVYSGNWTTTDYNISIQ
jgi:hypothetical protein